jgi:hypothetical protein
VRGSFSGSEADTEIVEVLPGRTELGVAVRLVMVGGWFAGGGGKAFLISLTISASI